MSFFHEFCQLKKLVSDLIDEESFYLLSITPKNSWRRISESNIIFYSTKLIWKKLCKRIELISSVENAKDLYMGEIMYFLSERIKIHINWIIALFFLFRMKDMSKIFPKKEMLEKAETVDISFLREEYIKDLKKNFKVKKLVTVKFFLHCLFSFSIILNRSSEKGIRNIKELIEIMKEDYITAILKGIQFKSISFS